MSGLVGLFTKPTTQLDFIEFQKCKSILHVGVRVINQLGVQILKVRLVERVDLLVDGGSMAKINDRSPSYLVEI